MKLLIESMDKLLAKTDYEIKKEYEDEKLNTYLNSWSFCEEKEAILQGMFHKSLEVILYSKYYWCSRYKERFREVYGADAVLINGSYACAHFFLNEEGDMWQSVGYGDKDIVFVNNGEESEMPADSIISLERAVECAKQFYQTKKKPTCIEWREL